MRQIFKDPIERLLYLSLVVLFIAAGLGIAIISIELNTLNTLGKSIQTEAKATREHTDCVAELLTKANRGSVRIQDLTNCKIGP